jgi:hypothetical protein
MMLEVQTKSSLDLYQNCFLKIGRQSYLCDNDFRSSRLKLTSVWDMFILYKYFFRGMVFVLAKSFNLDDRKSLSHK